MTIGKKLYINFGAILAIVLFLFLVNFVAMRQQQSAREATQKAMEIARVCESVRTQKMQNQLDLSNYLLSGDLREAANVTQGILTLKELLNEAESKALSEAERQPLRNLRAAEVNWEKDFAQPLIEKRRQVHSGNSTVAELQVFYIQQNPATWLKASTDLLEAAEQATNQELEQRKRADALTVTISNIITSLGAVLVIGLGVLISYRTSKSFTQPLGELMTAARNIGDSGDLEQTIDIDRQDEIGELARSFSGMVAYLKEMAAISEAIAEGSLKSEVKPRSERDTLGNAFLRMAESLGTTVRKVRDSASQVTSASSQVASTSEETAKISVQASSAIDEVTSTMHEMSINVQNMVKNTQMQASSVSETSASIDQMIASIQRVAHTSKALLDISNRSRQEVQSGISTMDKTTDGLNRINTSIQTSAEIIGILDQRTEDIGRIVEVIDDIAEQTNLLALNAAIEAARAGEHGLGFAVVADEVRKLAEKSAQSTREISELIQSIQKEASRAVENMDRSTTIVNEGLELGTDLGNALKKISNVVIEVNKFAQEIGAATTEQSHGSSLIAKATSRLNEITHEINSSVEEQASGTQAVVNAMERMREMIQQNASSSTELAASAEQMQRMSRILMESMDSFKMETLNDLQQQREVLRARNMATGRY